MKRIPLIYIAIGCYRKAKLQEEVGPSLGKFLWSRILIQDVDATNSGVHDVGTSTWDRASLDVPIKTDQPEIFFRVKSSHLISKALINIINLNRDQ